MMPFLSYKECVNRLQSQVNDSPITRAPAVLRTADNYGGRMAFRWVAPTCGHCFHLMVPQRTAEQRRRGYQVERLDKRDP